MTELDDVLKQRNEQARGSGVPPIFAGSGGSSYGPSPTPPPEEDMAIETLPYNGDVKGGAVASSLFLNPTGYKDTNESRASYAMPSSVSRTVQNTKVNIATNSLSAATPITLTLRKNGADTAITQTFTNATPLGVHSIPGSVSYSPDDLLTWRHGQPNGDGVDRTFESVLSYEIS